MSDKFKDPGGLSGPYRYRDPVIGRETVGGVPGWLGSDQ